MNENIDEIITGTLLGDASIYFNNYDYRKYLGYKLIAKDTEFLNWVGNLLQTCGIRVWTSLDNKVSDVHSLHFYINSCPYPDFLGLREKWYKAENGKNRKIIPRDIRFTPTVLLHWYFGDGSLVRMTGNRIPKIVLATNCFSKSDIDFLIEKLKELGLNFYANASVSGFNKGSPCGHVLISKTDDGTPFRFFRLLGLNCPEEIKNCYTGRKGRGSKLHYFKDKWPTEEDWLRILSNVEGLGRILKQRRKESRLSLSQLGGKIGKNRDYVKQMEKGRFYPSVPTLRKLLNTLGINSFYVLEMLDSMPGEQHYGIRAHKAGRKECQRID